MCVPLQHAAGPGPQSCSTGSGAERCQVNHSFPSPPFWQSCTTSHFQQRALAAGGCRAVTLLSEHRSPCARSPTAQSNAGSAYRSIHAQTQPGPSPLPRAPSRHTYCWLWAKPFRAAAAAHGSLSSSAACIKAIKRNRITPINLPLFPPAQRQCLSEVLSAGEIPRLRVTLDSGQLHYLHSGN